jgi:hypothetical protein
LVFFFFQVLGLGLGGWKLEGTLDSPLSTPNIAWKKKPGHWTFHASFIRGEGGSPENDIWTWKLIFQF